MSAKASFLRHLSEDSRGCMSTQKALSSVLGTLVLWLCLFCQGKKKGCQSDRSLLFLGFIPLFCWLVTYFGTGWFSGWSRAIFLCFVVLIICWCLHFLDKAKIQTVCFFGKISTWTWLRVWGGVEVCKWNVTLVCMKYEVLKVQEETAELKV